MTGESATSGVHCHNCRHFYITWDERFPYGCEALGFKGRFLPCLSVRNASGFSCLYFEPKTAPPRPPSTLPGTIIC